MRDRSGLVLGLACLSIPASIIGGCSSDDRAAERTGAESFSVEAEAARGAGTVESFGSVRAGGGDRTARHIASTALISHGAAAAVAPVCNQPPYSLQKGSGGVFPLPSSDDAATLAPVLWGNTTNPANVTAVDNLAYALGASASGIVFFSPPVFEPEPYSSWLQSEYDIPPVGSAAYRTIITPQVCNAPTGACTVTDAQIQAELQRQVNLGVLETGSALLYVLEFPPNVTVVDSAGNKTCALPGICAYHSFTSVNGTNLAYIVLPDYLSPGSTCFGICGNWPTAQGQMTAVLSHEIIETLTDPFGAGWQDPGKGCNEIGDICNGEDVQINNAGYTAVVQKMWSNSLAGCFALTVGPDITSITPSSGLGTTSMLVTVTGTGLSSSTRFLFGPAAATAVNCVSSTQCSMVAPALNGFGSPFLTVTVSAIDPSGYESVQEPSGDSFTFQCVPTGCSSTSCGAAPDGCGGTLSCGSCPGGESCNNGQCCQPSTCSDLGKNCGMYADGCGGDVICGSCPSSMVCQQGVCVGSGGSGGAFCQNCRSTGGICTTSGGKSICIHE